MSRSTISTFELFAMIPDAETARLYLESRLWPDGPTCPSCVTRKRITTRKDGFYRCNQCKTDFTVRTATIFERSHVPLHKWVYAMYLVVTARKGISSMQLAKEIGVTQKTAWFMLQRLREACAGNQITDVVLNYKPKRKRQGRTERTSPKQRLIDQIVQWRHQMGGSISVHNHRRLLNTWSTSELQFLWDKIQTGEGSHIWKERTGNQ